MGVVTLVAALDLRRRWASVLFVTLVVGLTGASAFAFAAGARRSSTALTRFNDSSRSADVELQAAPPTVAQLAALEAIDGVVGVTVLRTYGVLLPAAPDFVGTVVPDAEPNGDTVDQDRIVAGRGANPDSTNEVTIGEGIAARLDLGVGDHLQAVTLTPDQVDAILAGAADAGPPAGPSFALSVVGIVRSPLDLGDPRATAGLVTLTPAFGREYAEQIGLFGVRIRIRTAHGAADVPEVTDAAGRIFGSGLFSAQGLEIDSQGASDAILVLTLSSWIAAGLVSLVGGATVAALLAREIGAVAADQALFRHLGCTRWQRVAMLGPSTMFVALTGATLAGVGAVALSVLFPFGVARRADPDIGIHADWVVLAAGGVAVVALVTAIGLVGSYRATTPSPTWAVRRFTRPPFSTRLATLGVRPSVANGVRLALEPGRGRTAVPVRSSVVGVVVGVVGIVAVGVVAWNLSTLIASPSAYGSDWDLTIVDVSNNSPCGGSDRGIATVTGIDALAEVCLQNVTIGGRPVRALAVTDLKGDAIGLGITAGRTPSAPEEVALGAKTMDGMGAHVGDSVTVAGRGTNRTYVIVGRAVFPTIVQSQPLADGALFTGVGYAPLFDQNLFQRAFLARLSPDADRAEVDRQLDAVADTAAPATPIVPIEIDRLDQVRWLLGVLLLLFGALSVVALGHALMLLVQRRRRELAILKALGFSRRQLRWTVLTSAVTMAAIGFVVGCPLGLIVGSSVWHRLASGLGIPTTVTIPLGALALVAIATLVTAVLVAWLPARIAARTSPAAVLRSD
ncbi:MAG: FtsX-like permease family protein [Ilumatobacteraceae bacterium]